MEIVRTTNIKLDLDTDIAQRTVEAWSAACNHISGIAFEHGRLSNAVHLHRLVYSDIRARFRLSAQVAQNAIRQVASKYAIARTTKKTLKKPVSFGQCAAALQGGERGQDFGFRVGGLSVWTLDGRMKNITFHASPKLAEYLADWKMGDGRLFIHKGKVFLAVSLNRRPSVWR